MQEKVSYSFSRWEPKNNIYFYWTYRILILAGNLQYQKISVWLKPQFNWITRIEFGWCLLCKGHMAEIWLKGPILSVQKVQGLGFYSSKLDSIGIWWNGLNLTINDVQEDSSRRNILLPITGLESVALRRFTHTQIKIPEKRKTCIDQPVQDVAPELELAFWNFKPGRRLTFCAPQNKAPLGRCSLSTGPWPPRSRDPQVSSGLSSLQRNLVELWLSELRQSHEVEVSLFVLKNWPHGFLFVF